MSSARYTAMRRVKTQAQDKKVQIDTRLALSNGLVSAVGCSLDYEPIIWKPNCRCNKPSYIPPFVPCPPVPRLDDYGLLIPGVTFILQANLTVLQCQTLVINTPGLSFGVGSSLTNYGTIIFSFQNDFFLTGGPFQNFGQVTFNGSNTIVSSGGVNEFITNNGTIINNSTFQPVNNIIIYILNNGRFDNTNGTINNPGFGFGNTGIVCGGTVIGNLPPGYTLTC